MERGDGPYYKQRRTEIRPRPYASFKDRFYAVGMSSDSVPVVARLGAKMMSFAQKPWAEMTDHFNRYRDLYREHHNTQPPSPVCVDFLSCDESAELAEQNARKYMANYYMTVMEHYNMTSDHFREMKGYGDYADNAELLRETGMADAANAFVDINPPAQRRLTQSPASGAASRTRTDPAPHPLGKARTRIVSAAARPRSSTTRTVNRPGRGVQK